jgi:hypothetical protein
LGLNISIRQGYVLQEFASRFAVYYDPQAKDLESKRTWILEILRGEGKLEETTWREICRELRASEEHDPNLFAFASHCAQPRVWQLRGAKLSSSKTLFPLANRVEILLRVTQVISILVLFMGRLWSVIGEF